ncbi:DNA-3-methyladenine glycosylase 2 [Saccharospirillum mangrovi]|uniref:DNA-3-methyladenine glycosylase 2 n=1 Tax=Saccharospirillum mangrovi TaxID=2161747 RepID=UPI000D3A25F7|nr:DNA-3-methyladenine glycosylase [Saccharospirillum mangrovi]
MTPNKRLTLELPNNFQRNGFIAFHNRDGEAIAERCSDDSVTKALLLNGEAITLHFQFAASQVLVEAFGVAIREPELKNIAQKMLGLNQSADAFEAQFSDHPELGALLKQQSGLRVPQSATPFEALVWAIVGQQISVIVAINIRRRLIQAVNQTAPENLLAFPDADAIAKLSDDELKNCGFSRAKIIAIRNLCAAVLSNDINLNADGLSLDVETLSAQLLALKGIGPWTVSYALLRGFDWLDGSLHGDVAVRKNLGQLLALAATPDAQFTEHWLAQFSPWRALVAAHLWARANAAGY